MKKGALCTAAIVFFFGIWVNASTALNSQELRTFLTPDFPGFSPAVNIDEKDRSRNQHAEVPMEYRIIQTPGAPISTPGGIYQAINRQQDISARFDSRGVNLRSGGEKDSLWHMTMSLSAFGSSDSMEPVSKIDESLVHVAGHRIEYPHGKLTEWFENTEKGLEHGFTFFAPPARPESHVSPLIIEMQLTGSLVPRLNRNSDALAFYEAQGQPVLQYGGLKAWDSLQRILPAKLRLARGNGNDLPHQLAFVVDDSQAVYPITIDPLFTSTKNLVRLEWAWSYQFGKSVAIDADTVLIGAPMGSKDNGGSTGTAYVYYREFDAGSWGQIKKIAASNGVTGDEFGTSVAIDGDTAVVCSNNTSSAGDYYNRAYIYYRDQGGADNWGQVKYISMGFSTRFGDSVAIDGDTLVVGDSTADNSGSKTGAVYVYGRNQGGLNAWGLVKKIVANDGQISDYFGYSVAIDGDTIAVGAWGDDDRGANCGAAYIFERNSGGPDNWGQAMKISPVDAAAEDRFGYAVSISGDTLVAGAYLKDGVDANSGAAYVFQRDLGERANGAKPLN